MLCNSVHYCLSVPTVHHTDRNSLYKEGKLGRTVIDTIGTAISGPLYCFFVYIML